MTGETGDRKVVVKFEIDYEDYILLSNLARSKGYPLVTDYLRDLARRTARGELEAAGRVDERRLAEYVAKRVERVVSDLINPFTGKIDDVHRRLAELIEIVERKEEAEEEKPATPARETPAFKRYPSAIERLRLEKVVFSDEVKWLKAPEKFFQKLEREGAVVIESGDERFAVDKDFWRDFVDTLEEISVRSVEEVESILAESLGNKASKLFAKLVRLGIIYYDEDKARWVISGT